MNKQIHVKTLETHPDGFSTITYTDHTGKEKIQKAALCAFGEHYTGFGGEETYLILTFENIGVEDGQS